MKKVLMFLGGMWVGNKLTTKLIGYAFADAERFEAKIKHVLEVAYRSDPETYLKIFREIVSESMKEDKHDAGEN